MRHRISKYIISLCFLCVGQVLFAQTTPETTAKVAMDTIHTPKTAPAPIAYPLRYGLRIGTDLYRISRSIYDKKYSGLEIEADYRLNKKWFAVAELGMEDKEANEQTYGYTTKGNYLRLGANFNLYENWLNAENQIYVGFRYGFSTFKQTLNWYQSYTTDPYFPAEVIQANKQYSGLSAHWLELVVGVKAQLMKNLFMGFSLRMNGLVSQKQPDNFENLYIPGYNKKHSGNIGVGFNYTISYFIPMYKSKKGSFKVPTDTPDNYDIEGNRMESEDLKFINQNKQKVN